MSLVSKHAATAGLRHRSRSPSHGERQMNASYIISVARKLGCSIFLLPEDILEVNQKMMLTLTASIMYWHLKRPASYSLDTENGSSRETSSTSASDDSASESSIDDSGAR